VKKTFNRSCNGSEGCQDDGVPLQAFPRASGSSYHHWGKSRSHVALIEILSPGNKHSQHTIGDFLDQVMSALREGFHVLVIDLFPSGRCDPGGMHGVIWEYLTNEP